MSTTNNKSGGSAWSRPLNNNRGRFGGSGGGGSGRAPPGMEGSRDTNNTSRNNSWRGGGRSNNTNPNSQTPNNNSNRSKASPSSGPSPVESKEQNERNVLRERFLHLCISMIGQTVTLTQTNGLVLEGIFHTFAPFENQPKGIKNIYVIQACKMVTPPNDASEGTFENGATVLVPASKVASVHVKSMRLDAANAAEKGVASGASDDMFQTDSQISGGKGGNDHLVAAGSEWTSAGAGAGDALEGGGPMSSRNNAGTRGGSDAMNWRSKKSPASGGAVSGSMDDSIGNWDQFAANQEKFGVKTSFDENLYTTKLDREKIDQAKFKHAERIAREIESQATRNIHLAEERNQKLAMDFDEEDLYSGVLDKSGKDKAAREEEARKKAAAPKMSWAAAAAKKKDGEGGGAPAVEKPKAAAVEVAATPDISELKVSSEEPKVGEIEAEEEPKVAEDKKAEEDSKEEEKKEEKPKSTKLNANAKEFTFNPGAKTFTPSAPSVPAPAQHMPGPMMGGPQFVPGGPPMQGMMQVPMPMQQYPGAPYGGMPPPQQGGPQPPGQPQQQEGGGEASSATGEGSEAGQQQQQQQQQPPQYMPQPGFGGVPPGGYPGYYPPPGPGGAAHPMMHPQARPGPGFHPQMGQQMMPGQVPYQRMFAPGMPPGGMRGPPGQYYPGGAPYAGGGYPHGGPDDDYYRRNSGGRGRGGKKKNFDRRHSGGRGGRGGYHHNNGYEGGRSGDPSPNNEFEANADTQTAEGTAAASENNSAPGPQSTTEGGGT